MRITKQQLVEKSACSDQVAVFTREWPDGVEITLPILERAVALKLDLDWFAHWFLSAPARAEYDRVSATAWVEYERVRATAWVEYDRVTAPARAERDRVMATALAEYERVMATALAEYDRVSATARAERDRVSATALWAGLQFDARRAELRAARGDRDGK